MGASVNTNAIVHMAWVKARAYSIARKIKKTSGKAISQDEIMQRLQPCILERYEYLGEKEVLVSFDKYIELRRQIIAEFCAEEKEK